MAAVSHAGRCSHASSPEAPSVDHRHQRRDDRPGVVVLVDVAAIDHALRALRHQRGGLAEHAAEVLLAAAAHQHRARAPPRRRGGNPPGSSVGSALMMSAPISRGKPHQGDDLVGVAVHLVAAAHVVRQHHQRLDHQRHAVAARRPRGRGDVLDALAEQLRLVRQHEEVHHHAGGVHLERADDRLVARSAARTTSPGGVGRCRGCPCRCA